MSKDKPANGKARLGKALALALVVGGGAAGGAFALLELGIMGTPAEASDNTPKLVGKGEEDPYAPPPEEGEEQPQSELVYGDGGEKYRIAYWTFGDDFTSNLKETDALVQMTLAVSTRRDGRVLMWLGEHELALRSEVLTVLADTPEEALRSPAGKKRLQKRLAAAINALLTRSEGFGGVDQVYFRSLIVQ